jgi:hypothetical protein
MKNNTIGRVRIVHLNDHVRVVSSPKWSVESNGALWAVPVSASAGSRYHVPERKPSGGKKEKKMPPAVLLPSPIIGLPSLPDLDLNLQGSC